MPKEKKNYTNCKYTTSFSYFLRVKRKSCIKKERKFIKAFIHVFHYSTNICTNETKRNETNKNLNSEYLKNKIQNHSVDSSILSQRNNACYPPKRKKENEPEYSQTP